MCLKTRLNQHMEDAKSTVYKYINKNYVNETTVEPIVFATSVDQWTKKGLDAVENKRILEFADKYEDRVLNKRNNPNKRRRLEKMSKLKQYMSY